MNAIVIAQPGGPEVLTLRKVPTPHASRGEVRVRIRATAVNRADLLQRMGMYAAPPDVPADIPGLELAGEIDELGEGVTSWKVGDRVFGLCGGGSYAEQIVLHARALARMPDGMSFTDAAAVPEVFITAWDAMITQAHLAASETVLISACGSGVGTAALQIARAIGARSVGTARTSSKLERARQLGLDHGFVATTPSFAEAVRQLTGERGADVILELAGGAYVAEDVAAAAPGGRIVVVGLVAGVSSEIPLAPLLHKRLTIIGSVLRARPLEEKIAVTQTFARHVVPLLADGTLKPIVDQILPLSEAAAAHRHVASNESFGKVVLRVD